MKRTQRIKMAIYNAQSQLIRDWIDYWSQWFELVWLLPVRWSMWKELFMLGPCFKYRGDEIVWDWRKKNWISITLEGMRYLKLKEIDAFWDSYYEYEKNCPVTMPEF